MKPKKCKECGELFTPTRQLQPTCNNIECMASYSMKHLSRKKKEKKKESSKALKEFNWNDRKWLAATAQPLANKWGRLRDELKNGRRCITCGKTTGKLDGGHAFPTSGFSAIRYYTKQIHQQCVSCNERNSGRYHEYRLILREMYGDKFVDDMLATKNVLGKYSTEWYQRFIPLARKRIRALEKRLKGKK